MNSNENNVIIMGMFHKRTTVHNDEPIYLSVVLCTYNDSKYIWESINSILRQSYPYFEFIIVNDGSTDNTLDIINSFQDDRIVLVDKPNTGLVDSLNVGISHAKYDWIARMDGDDVADINRFKNQIPYIRKGYDVIGGGAVYIDMESRELYPAHPAKRDIIIKFLLSIGIGQIIHPAAIINKNKLLAIGGYDSHIICAQDKDLWLMLYHSCKMINIPEIVLKYRINTAGISVSKKDKQRLFGLVAFVKFKKKIYRPLTDEEYDRISNNIVNNEEYSVFLRICETEGTGVLRSKYLALKQIIKYNLLANRISRL